MSSLGASRRRLVRSRKLPTLDHVATNIYGDDHAWPVLTGKFLGVGRCQPLSRKPISLRVAHEVDHPPEETNGLDSENLRLARSTERRQTCRIE
jgi:hypothetical protein